MNAEQKKVISDLYHALYQFLVRDADSSLKNTALAEEAVQEAFSIACAMLFSEPSAYRTRNGYSEWYKSLINFFCSAFIGAISLPFLKNADILCQKMSAMEKLYRSMGYFARCSYIGISFRYDISH